MLTTTKWLMKMGILCSIFVMFSRNVTKLYKKTCLYYISSPPAPPPADAAAAANTTATPATPENNL
jgi:hypothetical protein